MNPDRRQGFALCYLSANSSPAFIKYLCQALDPGNTVSAFLGWWGQMISVPNSKAVMKEPCSSSWGVGQWDLSGNLQPKTCHQWLGSSSKFIRTLSKGVVNYFQQPLHCSWGSMNCSLLNHRPKVFVCPSSQQTICWKLILRVMVLEVRTLGID
jgi:hypothetical protein